MRRATNLIQTYEIKILLNLPSIILVLIFLNVKTLIMLILFLEQARGRLAWSMRGLRARGHHVGDSWFKLYTNFNRVETGSLRNISFSFRFVAASKEKLFHVSVMNHNAEVKLCHLYQFAEALNGVANCKIFCPS